MRWCRPSRRAESMTWHRAHPLRAAPRSRRTGARRPHDLASGQQHVRGVRGNGRIVRVPARPRPARQLRYAISAGRPLIFAVQGPSSLRALAGVTATAQLRALPVFRARAGERRTEWHAAIGRLGYTGERGFEIIFPRAREKLIWEKLAEQARPAGFAAADILRIEAGFPLFANEFLFPVSAAELGLARFAAEPNVRCEAPSHERATPTRLRILPGAV